MTRIIACDPGVHGAVALYDGTSVSVYDYPIYTVTRKSKKLGKEVTTNRTHYDIPKLVELIKSLNPTEAIIEEVSARPNDGSVAGFSFGKGFGLLLGIVHTFGCTVNQVRPAIWKKALGLATGSTKNDSRLLALRLFPELAEDLKLKKYEGRAEAALLAHYFLNKENLTKTKSRAKKVK